MSNYFSRAWSEPGRGSSHASRPFHTRTPRAALIACLGAASLAVLTGCGGGGGGGGGGGSDTGGKSDVASIGSPSANGGSGGSSAGKSANPDAGRPQIRLDSTQNEINRMYDAWLACMTENGAPKDKTLNKPDSPWIVKCQGKQPLDPPEFDPAKNPHFMDDTRAMVQCMNKHGIKSVVTQEGWGLVDGASMSVPGFEQVQNTCQVEAFGDK
ncbi:hypothetical protein [Streptomyces sp. CBMA29]|uniref:hypothetical protein n=1 Tax=Streptomyces sp. CBMA29 TaxID=1896314 RepID=UPI001661BC13|nr:hypothetical protein [Streptomyces sp. CBMA29]